MKSLKMTIAKTLFPGCSLHFFCRAKTGFGYFKKPLSNLFKWLFISKETTNFTYDLEETNKRYLASLISDIVNEKFEY